MIYHLAAQANPQASVADPRGTWALNLGGTLNLLEAVKASGLKPAAGGPGRLGGLLRQPRPRAPARSRESCPLRPNNPYAASKAAADLLGIQHFLAHGTDVVMVRPFNHAGPRQSPTYVLGALARQVAEVEAGRKARVEVGNLDVVRDFTDVRDVVRGYRLLAERGPAGEIYNLGSGRGTKLADALEHLTTLAGRPVEVHVDPARVRPVDQPLLVADASKLRAATGWEPRFTIEQTLADMLQAARDRLTRLRGSRLAFIINLFFMKGSLMLPEITQTILNAKSAKRLTFLDLAQVVGCDPVWLAAVCYRQASPQHEQAVKLLDALGLDHALAPALTSFPVKGGRSLLFPPIRSSTGSTRSCRSMGCL